MDNTRKWKHLYPLWSSRDACWFVCFFCNCFQGDGATEQEHDECWEPCHCVRADCVTVSGDRPAEQPDGRQIRTRTDRDDDQPPHDAVRLIPPRTHAPFQSSLGRHTRARRLLELRPRPVFSPCTCCTETADLVVNKPAALLISSRLVQLSARLNLLFFYLRTLGLYICWLEQSQFVCMRVSVCVCVCACSLPVYT